MNPYRAPLGGSRQVGFRIAVALPPSPIVRHGHAPAELVLRFGCETDPIPKKSPCAGLIPAQSHVVRLDINGHTLPRTGRYPHAGRWLRPDRRPGWRRAARDFGPMVSSASRLRRADASGTWSQAVLGRQHRPNRVRRRDARDQGPGTFGPIATPLLRPRSKLAGAGCSLIISGEEDEVVRAAARHTAAAHGRSDAQIFGGRSARSAGKEAP